MIIRQELIVIYCHRKSMSALLLVFTFVVVYVAMVVLCPLDCPLYTIGTAMKATALLLILLWSLVEVHSQTVPYVSLSSSPLSPIVAGESLTLTCSVTLPAGVTGTPDFQWVGPGVTPTPAAPTTSGQEVSSILTLSAIATSQAGQYSCTASLSGSSVSTALTVTVQSKFTVINCLYTES